MIRKWPLLATLAVLVSHPAMSQQTFSGPPTEDDYTFFCKNYGAKGEKARDQCEAEMRIRRGVATCADITWTHSCQVDGMTDATNCLAHGKGSNLFVFAEKGKLAFGVTGDSYPGEDAKIRVDNNPAVSFDDDAGTTRAQDAAIEAQIRKGKVVKTRYIRWPSGVSSDNEAPICNLPSVFDAMKAESK